jgi:hypothetical protein
MVGDDPTGRDVHRSGEEAGTRALSRERIDTATTGAGDLAA